MAQFLTKQILTIGITPFTLIYSIVAAFTMKSNSGYLCCRYIPFSGGPRKCVGDQFALLEAIVALAVLLQHVSFELIPDQKIGMTTGATIHTTNVTFSKSMFFLPIVIFVLSFEYSVIH